MIQENIEPKKFFRLGTSIFNLKELKCIEIDKNFFYNGQNKKVLIFKFFSQETRFLLEDECEFFYNSFFSNFLMSPLERCFDFGGILIENLVKKSEKISYDEDDKYR